MSALGWILFAACLVAAGCLGGTIRGAYDDRQAECEREFRAAQRRRRPYQRRRSTVKVTLTIETDDQYTSVMRSGETPAVDRLLAECIMRVADTFNSHKLEAMAAAAKKAYEEANRRG